MSRIVRTFAIVGVEIGGENTRRRWSQGFASELPISRGKRLGALIARGSGLAFAKTSIPISQNFGNSPLPCRLNRAPMPKSAAVPAWPLVYERPGNTYSSGTMCCLRTFQRNCYNSEGRGRTGGVQLKARLFCRHLHPTIFDLELSNPERSAVSSILREKEPLSAIYLVNGDYDEHGMHSAILRQQFLNEQGRCKLLYIPNHNLVGYKI
ncbi:hypothetical protein K0M31_018450 [Melipona bicolor]|uniref:Uncharacterized protein n=1 Tax=Melipona bicolor TaxID=60889 RepID=A0AA40KRL5_9HYME|nr:hypothetical protein K0M31_018450 [Melipona bicolor]